MLTTEQAILKLRDDPVYRDRIESSYIGGDVIAAGRNFFASDEFKQVLNLVDGVDAGKKVLDLGAGIGIASYAFAKAGAGKVYALEPDPSNEIGRGAIERLCQGLAVEMIDAFGEKIPLPDQCVDVVYARQVLHHTSDLNAVLRECARILKPGGYFIACREHVVDNEQQLKEFLAAHPVHQLAGGENAFRLDQYLGAIRGADLDLVRAFGPWESVINAFPAVKTEQERLDFPGKALAKRLGSPGRLLARIPPVSWLLWRYLNRPTPGRAYTFVAKRPIP